MVALGSVHQARPWQHVGLGLDSLDHCPRILEGNVPGNEALILEPFSANTGVSLPLRAWVARCHTFAPVTTQ